MKIEIVFDLTKTYISENVLYGKTETDYFDLYINIRNAIKANTDIKIIISNAFLYKRIIRAIANYEANTIIKELTYKDILEEKANIICDVELINSDSEKLIQSGLKSKEKNLLSKFLLKIFFNEYLTNEKFIVADFTDIIIGIDNFKNVDSSLIDLSKYLLNNKLNNWKNTATNEERVVIEIIQNDFKKLKENLAKYKFLSHYPNEVQNTCIDKEFLSLFNKIRPNINGIEAKIDEKIIDEIKLFLIEYSKSPKFEIKELINFFSGELLEEINFITDNTKLFYGSLNINIINQLLNKFNVKFHQKINLLKKLIKPTVPSPFDSTVDLSNAFSWAINEYLPYKNWMDVTENYEKNILEYGEQFSDYYFINYEKISFHYVNTLHKFIFNNAERISSSVNPILLVIDNFNYRFIEILKNIFLKHGFALGLLEPYATLLPSITKVCKSAILSGSLFNKLNNSSDYETNLKNKISQVISTHTINYSSKLGNLIDYKMSDNELIVINYNDIDEELHKSFNKTAIEIEKVIEFKLDQLVDNIVMILRQNNRIEKAKLFFISDHGSVYDGSLEGVLEYQSLIKRRDLSHRYQGANIELFNKCKNDKNIADYYYFLDNEKSKDGHNYLIPKGYKTFKNRKDSCYVHGGISAEEVLVPGGYFEPIGKLKDIVINLSTKEYRIKTEEFLEIRLFNPNHEAIENLTITIFHHDSILLIINIETIQEFTEINEKYKIRFITDKTDKIKIEQKYFIAGNLITLNCEKQIIIKRSIKTNINLDDF